MIYPKQFLISISTVSLLCLVAIGRLYCSGSSSSESQEFVFVSSSQAISDIRLLRFIIINYQRMAVKKMILRSQPNNSSDNPQEPLLNTVKQIKKSGMHYGQTFTWILIILVGMTVYHSYNVYNQQIYAEEEQQKEGMDCLLQFKVQECNPMNLTDRCKQLLACVQESPQDIDEIEMAKQMITRTSQSLSETMLGPVVLIVGALLVNFIRPKS